MSDETVVLELERRQLPSAEAVLDLARTALGARKVRCDEQIVPAGVPPKVTVEFTSVRAATAFFHALLQFLPPGDLLEDFHDIFPRAPVPTEAVAHAEVPAGGPGGSPFPSPFAP
jgi:hypothetical protein